MQQSSPQENRSTIACWNMEELKDIWRTFRKIPRQADHNRALDMLLIEFPKILPCLLKSITFLKSNCTSEYLSLICT